MVAGGLMQLVAYGAQSVYYTASPYFDGLWDSYYTHAPDTYYTRPQNTSYTGTIETSYIGPQITFFKKVPRIISKCIVDSKYREQPKPISSIAEKLITDEGINSFLSALPYDCIEKIFNFVEFKDYIHLMQCNKNTMVTLSSYLYNLYGIPDNTNAIGYLMCKAGVFDFDNVSDS